MWKNEAEAREQIKAMVAEYYHDFKEKKTPYQEGDRITYAARVFDEKEMCALTDATLDFWLTTGRFADQFEKEFAKWIGVKFAHLVNSGSSANLAAYMSVLKPGDTILAMILNNGGHLTHGSPVNFSGKLFHMEFYGVDENGFIDYEDVRRKARECRPQLILAGASAYSRIIDFPAFADAAREAGAYFMVDMAHIAGLVAAGDHPSPFGLADIITTTTHKTLRGTRSGLIFCRPELAKRVDSAVFPGCQGGALQHVIAGKAVTAEEASTEEFREYIHAVVRNCRAMCDEFISMGYKVVTGGTDNHLFLLDLTDTGLTGKAVQDELDRHGITLNKNCVPNESRSPQQTSGVRIGTAAMTTKGYTEQDFIAVARQIDRIIRDMQDMRKE